MLDIFIIVYFFNEFKFSEREKKDIRKVLKIYIDVGWEIGLGICRESCKEVDMLRER